MGRNRFGQEATGPGEATRRAGRRRDRQKRQKPRVEDGGGEAGSTLPFEDGSPLLPRSRRLSGAAHPQVAQLGLKGRAGAWASLLCILQAMCGCNPGAPPPKNDWGSGLERAAQLDPSPLQLGTVSPLRLWVSGWGPGAAERAWPGTHSISREVRGRCSAGQDRLLGPGGQGCAERGRHRRGHSPQRAGYCPGAAGWARARAASARSLHPARPRAPPAGRRRPHRCRCTPKRRPDPGPSHPELWVGEKESRYSSGPEMEPRAAG